MATVSISDNFTFELVSRASQSALESMSTSALALLSAIAYGGYRVFLTYKREGRQGVKAHFAKDIRHAVIFGIAWWGILFSYHLIIKVPMQIRSEASLVIPPKIRTTPFAPMTVKSLNHAVAMPAIRAHLQVEEVSVDVETNGPSYWWNLWAHIRGYNRSITPTLGGVQVLAGVKVSAPLPSAKAEEEQLFENKSLWANELIVSADVYSQQPFEFKKHENLTTLDGERNHDTPFSSQTAHDLKEGRLLVYVVARIIYRDQYGPLPENRSCWAFKYNPDSGKFESPGQCYLSLEHVFDNR